MPKIKEGLRQGKTAVIIVVLLILVGLGIALQGRLTGSSVGIPNIFGLQNVPSLTQSVRYSSDLSADVRQILETTIADLRRALTENADLYDTWLTLAIRYKQAGDLEKSREVWEYLASIHPDDAVSRHNLGDLYHHFLNDYQKAETYYGQALDLTPTNSLEYLALHELYRYSLKESTAAVEILKLGIDRVTENQPIDLHITLAGYYAHEGDKVEAIESYTSARDLANSAGNSGLVAQLNAEIARLR